MSLIETAKELIKRGEVKEASTNLLEDIASAILGNTVAIGKIILALVKAPFFIREQLFWVKMEHFLNGVYLNEKDKANLQSKISGGNSDNQYRLIECIDRAETQKKISYLINATRCLLSDCIDLPMYFRICHTITHTLDEDLSFLSKRINDSDLSYSTYVQGLLITGLMYQSVIDVNGEQKYSFTPLAKNIYHYAVSYNNNEKYPTTMHDNDTVFTPQLKFLGISNWEEISEEEIDEMFKK